jgi:hypothetical protein
MDIIANLIFIGKHISLWEEFAFPYVVNSISIYAFFRKDPSLLLTSHNTVLFKIDLNY